MASVPDLSIVIVNWNSVKFLRKCLCSIYAQTKNLQFEVIVIDNASFDGSAEMMAREFPKARFLQGRENAGFARANNAAFAESAGRAVLFLNPDTEVIGEALERMVRFLDATPAAGAVGCKLLNTDGSVQTSCIQAYPTILNQAFDTELLRRFFPRSRWWGMRPLVEGALRTSEVEVISGACLLARRVAFEKVGQFTTDYFMYSEDLDFCFKLNRAGLKNYYLGDASVTHHGGQSTDTMPESQFSNVVMRESVTKFLRLHRGAAYAEGYRLTTALVAAVRLVFLGGVLVVSLGRFRPVALRNGLQKWTKVLRWALGMEPWAAQLGVRRA